MEISKDVLAALIDGKLDWERTKAIISGEKDLDRFDKYIEILQERVPWKEKIVLPLGEHLYIVQKDREYVVKCDCGYEFGDYRVNWKLNALIHVRDTKEKLLEVYPYPESPGLPDPEYCNIREFYCPNCGALLEVEAVPKFYPIIFDFLPDLGTFYSDWLNRPLPFPTEFKDLTYDVTKEWRKELEE
ncbi:MAG: acetone carboxylase subunit gamma [Thermoproteota archaeon]|nr:MAG: acetone carboxylase subunit gamma [Candidatus Korarchaeota archaeon]